MESCDVAVLWSKIDRLAKIEISRSESRGNSQTGAHGEQVRDTGSTFPPLSASSPSLFHVLS